MDSHTADQDKRRFLVVVTSTMGGLAAASGAIPFVASMLPSQRARAAGAPVEVDISRIEPGMMISVEWRGKPVWIVHRTQEMLNDLAKLDARLADPKSEASAQPDYARNPHRSIKPQYLVALGVCTHLGCSPTFRRDKAPADLGADWMGGFYCPCHGSRFDLAARVYSGVPAPANLEIPPHTYLSDTRLLIGEDKKA